MHLDSQKASVKIGPLVCKGTIEEDLHQIHPECVFHRVINEKSRRFDQQTIGEPKCDGGNTDGQWNGSGWYRFKGNGTKIRTGSVDKNYCGAITTLFIKEGVTHPTEKHQMKSMQICNSYTSYCGSSISAINCGEYFVYKLFQATCSYGDGKLRFCIE